MVPDDLLSFAACMDVESMPVTCMGTRPCAPHLCCSCTAHCAAHAQLTVPLLLQDPIARDRLHPSAALSTTLPAPDQKHMSSQEAPRLFTRSAQVPMLIPLGAS